MLNKRINVVVVIESEVNNIFHHSKKCPFRTFRKYCHFFTNRRIFIESEQWSRPNRQSKKRKEKEFVVLEFRK